MPISKDESNFIRLLMLSTDLSSDVLKAFVESQVLCNYNDDIVDLLEVHKHDLFHVWVPNVNCCQCSSVAMGSLVRKKFSTINEAIFVKLYENHGSTHSGHFKRGLHGLVTQHCLCRYSARSDLRLEDLDMGVLSIIIFQCVQLKKKDHESIKAIQNMRWEIMAEGESRSYPTDAFTKTWENLKDAVIGLAKDHFSGSHRRITERQIELIKIAEVDKVNVDELMEKLNSEKEVARYLNSSKKGDFNGMTDGRKQTDVNYIGRDEGIELDLDKVCDTKTATEFFTELMKKIRFDITHSALPRLVNGYLKTLGLRYCGFRLETPQTWDNKKMVAALNETDKVHQFKILKAEEGSLVIKTTANPEIMKDRETFQNAVRSFLEKLVEVCEIDTSVPATIPVEINISGGPFADTDLLSNGNATSNGAVGGISNGDGEVQFQIRSQECKECKEKQETIDRLQKELHEKDAYIADLEKRLAEKEISQNKDVDDVD